MKMTEPFTEQLLEHFQLKDIGNDKFVNCGNPWSHGHNNLLPGAYSLPQIALAAYITVPVENGHFLHCLQSHFLAPGSTNEPLLYKVDRVMTTSSSSLRSIRVEQNGKLIIVATASFTRKQGSSSRPAISHSAERQLRDPPSNTNFEIDDLDNTEIRAAGIAAERLPVYRSHDAPCPATDIVPIRLQMLSPTLSHELAQLSQTHIITLAGLSDLYVLDAPLSLHNLSYGIPAIGDKLRRSISPDTDLLATTNHTIYFHIYDCISINETFNVEISSPWAKGGRVFCESRIFSGAGQKNLVASCIQEGIILLKKNSPISRL